MASEPAYNAPDGQLWHGDVLDVLAELPAESVHCVVCSPPYWGLRKYSGDQERIWGGELFCEHEWRSGPSGEGFTGSSRWQHADKAGRQDEHISRANQPDAWAEIQQGQFCQLCEAWHGAYGLEPTPQMWVEHTIAWLREAKRVLRNDGVCFINVGSSYSGSNSGSNDYRPAGASISKSDAKYQGQKPGTPSGFKPLDLVWLAGLLYPALLADGWYVRSVVIWAKPNPMPESVAGWRWERCRVKVRQAKGLRGPNPDRHDGALGGPRDIQWGEYGPQWADCPGCSHCLPNDGLVFRKGSWRPTSSYEEIVMLAKSQDYFSDGEGVREAPSGRTDPWFWTNAAGKTVGQYNGLVGRNLRDTWTFPTQPMDWQMCTACKRVYSGTQYRWLAIGKMPACPTEIAPGEKCDNPLAWLDQLWHCGECGFECTDAAAKKLPRGKVCTCGAEAWLSHFATFPEELVERCILASTPEHGVCAQCGAPWARLIEKGDLVADAEGYKPRGRNNPEPGVKSALTPAGEEQGHPNFHYEQQTLGFRKTCRCDTEERRPATVLDPFGGSMTTAIVARKLGRRFTCIDISEDYVHLGIKRLEAVSLSLL